MARKHKNGFTLVELLAVIVILAIILVIAVPQIMKTIDNAREGALSSSAKLIAASAEREYLVRETLGDTEFNPENVEMECSEVAETTADYSDCDITFTNGKAYVSLTGSGKFEGKYVCNGTRESATVTETACSGGSGGSGDDGDTAVTGVSKITALANNATDAASNGLISANGIRYAGADSAVKNYIWFNCKDSYEKDGSTVNYGDEGYEYNSTNCELWRIIGVFDGRIKIVRDSTLADASGNELTMKFDSTSPYSNVWEGSEIEVYLNDGETSYYNSLSTEAKAEIGTQATWYVGAVSDGTADAVYANERTDTTGVQNYIGLIYPSDFGYAGTNCGNETIMYYDNSASCGKTNNWLTYSSIYWTISPRALYSGSVWSVSSAGYGYAPGNGVKSANFVRPSVYLASNVEIKDGDGSNGTATSSGAGPYVIGKMSVSA